MNLDLVLKAYKVIYPKLEGIHIRCAGGENYSLGHIEIKPNLVLHPEAYWFTDWDGVLAHAHVIPSEPFYHHICFSDRTYVLWEIIAHEYAHIMTDVANHPKEFEDNLRNLGFGDFTISDAIRIIRYRLGHPNEDPLARAFYQILT